MSRDHGRAEVVGFLQSRVVFRDVAEHLQPDAGAVEVLEILVLVPLVRLRFRDGPCEVLHEFCGFLVEDCQYGS